MVEFIQEPGDTVFVPAGWWHCVVNLEFSFAVTENLFMPAAIQVAWPQLQLDFPAFTTYVERAVGMWRMVCVCVCVCGRGGG